MSFSSAQRLLVSFLRGSFPGCPAMEVLVKILLSVQRLL